MKVKKKDSKEEKFLKKINLILGPHQEKEYQNLSETLPNLFILGTPRSGTTLLYQLIASCLDVGYISNLIAAFWEAPCFGVQLHKKFICDTPSSYKSVYGRTQNIYEPHEFGYFWRGILGDIMENNNHKNINWDRARLLLTNIANAFSKPVVYKGTFLLWYIKKIQEVLPKSVFVWIVRDPLQVAMSLLVAREEHAGAIDNWYSLKPDEYTWLKDKSCWEQIAGQVYYLEKTISQQTKGANNILKVSYDTLCQNPKQVLTQINDLLDIKSLPNWGHLPTESFCVKEREIKSNREHKLAEAIGKIYGI